MRAGKCVQVAVVVPIVERYERTRSSSALTVSFPIAVVVVDVPNATRQGIRQGSVPANADIQRMQESLDL